VSLPEWFIRAYAPERVCSVCGAGYAPLVETTRGDSEAGDRPKQTRGMGNGSTLSLSGNGSKEWAKRGTKTDTHGLLPSCDCNVPAGKAVVCDPFVGSGSTLIAARQLERTGIGVDLSEKYLREIARPRLGLTELEAWEHGIPSPANLDLSDLPMWAMEAKGE